MLMHVFFVIDEQGNQLADSKIGQINEFTSFRIASKVAREYSKTHNGLFSVGVCVPATMYKNGLVYRD